VPTAKRVTLQLLFEVIICFDCQILGVTSVHFGTRNDQQIVHSDETVTLIKTGQYRNVEWVYYDKFGKSQSDHGVNFICNGGCLRWPELVCPYKHEPVSSRKGIFCLKIESVQKDVECVFGILKKRWKILDYGIPFRDIQVVEKAFMVCCLLHNNVLSEMETRESDVRVGCGAPLEEDGLWIQGGDDRSFVLREDDRVLAALWGQQRACFAEHIYYCAKKAKCMTFSGSSSYLSMFNS
jgi:hypothetical protein